MSLVGLFVEDLGAPSTYRDRHYQGTEQDFLREIGQSATLYVGNLSFYTTEEQIYTFFSKSGPVKRIIMGLDKFTKTPCGFCFVEYFDRTDALTCKQFLDGSKLDERYIRIDLDPGFREGRQYGRGRRGGQVRDEFRAGYDPGRGGWGGVDQWSDDPGNGRDHSYRRQQHRRYGGGGANDDDNDDGDDSRNSRRQSGPSELFTKRSRLES